MANREPIDLIARPARASTASGPDPLFHDTREEGLDSRLVEVLVAGGDSPARAQVGHVLREAGYQTKLLASQTALDRVLLALEPDLVVLDIGLAGEQGMLSCQAIRRVSRVPILLLSAQPSTAQCVASLRCGGDDYLAKPFEPIELLARANALLRRRRLGMRWRPPQLVSPTLTLCPAEQRVLVAEQTSVRLTLTETRLLHLLMLHSGSTLASQQLAQALWSDTSRSAYQRLQVLVSRLRGKLERHLPERCIVTVANVGYRFEPV
jgi:two-component system OmpR family response regulator